VTENLKNFAKFSGTKPALRRAERIDRGQNVGMQSLAGERAGALLHLPNPVCTRVLGIKCLHASAASSRVIP
jgi:hypothetical protein